MRSSVRSRLSPPSFWDLASCKRPPPEDACRGRYLENAFAAAMISEDRQVRLIASCAKNISDIVKRECGRWGRESVSPGGHVRQAYGDGIGNGSVTGLFVTVSDFCSGSSGPSGKETDIDHESDQVP